MVPLEIEKDVRRLEAVTRDCSHGYDSCAPSDRVRVIRNEEDENEGYSRVKQRYRQAVEDIYGV